MASSSATLLGKRKSTALAPHVAPRKPRILLAACGCVAAKKFAILCNCFLKWADVKVVLTKASQRFVDIAGIPQFVAMYTDGYEWLSWKRLGDPVLHIELANWAEIMVIAPLSADTLSKIVRGSSGNLLTSIVRAWDYSKPMFVATAMNTLMWRHPLTERHCISIDDLGINLIPPPAGELDDPDFISNTVRLSYDKRMQKQQGVV
ncbi:hypothetical protein PIB30_101898 [Stylosanthes scabra]|uniref:phosphopantothenoylcysteine decarboxylase n=1 Tax=Stylosanthes scabra TaxID=79078 RepID=A0ABU6QYB1_9FABA|nr:hypothetical protein [Stylosanthes scabra]